MRSRITACSLFGAATALQFQLSAFGIGIPDALLIMLPYLLALLAVGGLVGRQMAPARIGSRSEPLRARLRSDGQASGRSCLGAPESGISLVSGRSRIAAGVIRGNGAVYPGLLPSRIGVGRTGLRLLNRCNLWLAVAL